MIELEKYWSGHFEKELGYKYFVPSFINDEWSWKIPVLNRLIEKAAIKLGELNSFARLVPNIDLFIQLHVTKEAVVSSRIEGTSTNMDEAVLPYEEIIPERRNDWLEVNNYIKALNEAIRELEKLPLSSRLIRKIHKILLTSARGEYKLPGEFRKSQNWIGGASLADAVYIPPRAELVNDLMSDLEKFLHSDDIQVPSLIRIGIAHYQFESIHPFLDGNGRIGRLLIPLFLVSEGLLDKPLLYLSAYFERNKNLYYDNLTMVRTKNDMVQWLKYFLVGIDQTATQAAQALSAVLDLKAEKENEIRLNYGRRSNSAIKLLDELFRNPVTTVEQASVTCDLSFKAANDLVSLFNKHKILMELTGQSRNRIFVFKSYLNIFDNQRV
jgi:Fic family protein